jgi:hypothetical protein
MRSPGAAFDLRTAMTQELNAALEELDSRDDTHKAVHRSRVRLKHARALARVGEVVAPGLAAVFNDSARSVMRTLAQAHDLAALADAARMLAETANEKSGAALVRAADNLDSARKALPALDLDNVRTGIRDLLALAQVWPEPSQRQVRAGAKRVAKRARRARRRGHATEAAASRHEWRKREKDRLYAAMLLNGAWPAPKRRKQSAALGHLLGLERDALLLTERLDAEPSIAGDETSTARAKRVLRKYSARIGRRADKMGKRLHADGV